MKVFLFVLFGAKTSFKFNLNSVRFVSCYLIRALVIIVC